MDPNYLSPTALSWALLEELDIFQQLWQFNATPNKTASVLSFARYPISQQARWIEICLIEFLINQPRNTQPLRFVSSHYEEANGRTV